MHKDVIRLGLIGDNIAASSSPDLHRLAGLQNGRIVTYERLVPRVEGIEFDALFAHCASGGYRGINVTYPYKERAALKVEIDDPLVRAVGAVNTVVFGSGEPKGFNTDYSGFICAYRRVRGSKPTGPVCMIGAGGVGRAIAFGLLALGARDIRIADRDTAKAKVLAEALTAAESGVQVRIGDDAGELARGASGLLNCTPVGMVGYDGTPLEREHMAGAAWAFDAVYTPVDTQFLKDAAKSVD